MVQFLCPNGHRIHCPDDQAGRAAKCPKCGVAFKIPSLDQPGTIAAADSGSGPLKIGGDSAVKAAVKEPQIEFLCPNGHRLHGPASMQGRAGQCPECGSKFRIPSYSDEISEEEELDQGVAMSGSAQAVGEMSVEPPLPISNHERLGDAGTPGNGLDSGDDQQQAAVESPPGRHDWEPTFGDLWAQRTAGVVIEVCFQDGQTIVPEHYAPDATGRQAIFAVKDSNGTYTLTAARWDSVVRVLVRGLKILPRSIFQV